MPRRVGPACARSRPGPEILNRDHHVAEIAIRRSDLEPPLPALEIGHRLDAVHDQIQYDLLKLNPIANDGIEIGGQRGFDPDAMAAELGRP